MAKSIILSLPISSLTTAVISFSKLGSETYSVSYEDITSLFDSISSDSPAGSATVLVAFSTCSSESSTNHIFVLYRSK